MALNVKPSEMEDEYFAREEAEKKRRLALEKAKKLAQAERDRLKALHHMHCPKCGMGLEEIGYQGVLIDKCFNCGGIFLDNGELEKLTGEHPEGYWARMLHFFARKDFSGE